MLLDGLTLSGTVGDFYSSVLSSNLLPLPQIAFTKSTAGANIFES